MKNLTVGRLIDESFQKYENRIAIKVHQGSRLTFGQAYERVSVMPTNGGSGLNQDKIIIFNLRQNFYAFTHVAVL